MAEFAHATGSKYKASSEFGGQPATNAFDNNTGTYWMGTGAGVDWLRVDTRPWLTPWIPTSYAIRVNSVPQPTRAPKNFTLDGSDDCVSWTTLDTRTNQTGWSSGEERTFTVTGVSTAYRFFRLNITANNGDATYTQCAELSMYGTAGVAPRPLISPPGNMLEYNDPAPYIATESGWWTNAGTNYKFFRAMNAAIVGTEKMWVVQSGAPWAQIYLGATAYVCGRYEILPQDHATLAPVRSPKNFTLKGSNDGSSWTTVDTVTDSTGWTADLPRFFTPDVTDTAYRYFRLDIAANNGDSYTTMLEFYLYGPLSIVDVTAAAGVIDVGTSPQAALIPESLTAEAGTVSVGASPQTAVISLPVTAEAGTASLGVSPQTAAAGGTISSQVVASAKGANPLRIPATGTVALLPGTVIATIAADLAGTVELFNESNVSQGTYTNDRVETNASNVVTTIASKAIPAAGNYYATYTMASAGAAAAVMLQATGLTPSIWADKVSGSWGTGAAPSSGPTATTAQANELLIGAIGTEGSESDAAGTWLDGMQPGVRLGTTGAAAASNITLAQGSRLVAAAGTYRAAKSGITSRDWAAAIVTYRGELPASVPAIAQPETAAIDVTVEPAEAGAAAAAQTGTVDLAVSLDAVEALAGATALPGTVDLAVLLESIGTVTADATALPAGALVGVELLPIHLPPARKPVAVVAAERRGWAVKHETREFKVKLKA